MYGRKSVTLWVIAAVGVGLIGYGAQLWLNRTQLSPQQMAGSVELNYQLDIATMRAHSEDGKLNLSDAWKQKHREAIHQELKAQLQKERDTAQSWMLAGLAALIFSMGRIFLVPMFQRRD